jgi:hypothetical protein
VPAIYPSIAGAENEPGQARRFLDLVDCGAQPVEVDAAPELPPVCENIEAPNQRFPPSDSTPPNDGLPQVEA